MPHKLFEVEVGKSLTALPRTWYYKPRDGVIQNYDHVDFHAIIDGVGVNIEAKETTSTKTFNMRDVTDGQRACLRETERVGGLGLLVVNFGRIRAIEGRTRGLLVAYLYGNVEGKTKLTPADAYSSSLPIPGGTWDMDWLWDLVKWRKRTP